MGRAMIQLAKSPSPPRKGRGRGDRERQVLTRCSCLALAFWLHEGSRGCPEQYLVTGSWEVSTGLLLPSRRDSANAKHRLRNGSFVVALGRAHVLLCAISVQHRRTSSTRGVSWQLQPCIALTMWSSSALPQNPVVAHTVAQ